MPKRRGATSALAGVHPHFCCPNFFFSNSSSSTQTKVSKFLPTATTMWDVPVSASPSLFSFSSCSAGSTATARGRIGLERGSTPLERGHLRQEREELACPSNELGEEPQCQGVRSRSRAMKKQHALRFGRAWERRSHTAAREIHGPAQGWREEAVLVVSTARSPPRSPCPPRILLPRHDCSGKERGSHAWKESGRRARGRGGDTLAGVEGFDRPHSGCRAILYCARENGQMGAKV